MSADNGIYILVTKSDDGEDGVEYRVKHAQAIENLYYRPIGHPDYGDAKFVPQEAFSFFGNCEVFYDKSYAHNAAHMLSEGCEILEYGIQELKHQDQYFEEFTDLEMEEYEDNTRRVSQEYRDNRDREFAEKREKAMVTLKPGEVIDVGVVYGVTLVHAKDERGFDLRGTVSGLAEITVTKEMGEITFLPNGWDD